MEDVVVLGTEFSSVDLVEDLHEDEGVKDQSEVLGLLRGGEGTVDWVNNEEGDTVVVSVAE